MLVFAALQNGSLDHRKADEKELHTRADAAHGAAGRMVRVSCWMAPRESTSWMRKAALLTDCPKSKKNELGKFSDSTDEIVRTVWAFEDDRINSASFPHHIRSPKECRQGSTQADRWEGNILVTCVVAARFATQCFDSLFRYDWNHD